MLSQIGGAKRHTKTQNAYYDSTNIVSMTSVDSVQKNVDNLDDYVKEEALPLLEGSLLASMDTIDEVLRTEQRNTSVFLNATAVDYTINGWNKLAFNTLHFISGFYDALNYRYVAQIDGVYDVKCYVEMGHIADGSIYVTMGQLAVYKNNAAYKILDRNHTYNSGDLTVWFNGSCQVSLKAGDYISIHYRPQGTGVAIRDHNITTHYGYLDIHYSGNHLHTQTDVIPITWSL